MGGYLCSKCGKCTVGGVKGLATHFRHNHGLSVTSYQILGWKCGEVGCCCVFRCFSSLARHLRQRHPLSETSSPELARQSVWGAIQSATDENHDQAMDVEENNARNMPHPCANPVSIPGEAIKLVAHLRSKANVTGTSLHEAILGAEIFAQNILDGIKNDVFSVLANHGISLDSPDVMRVFSNFDLSESFIGYSNITKQIKALKKNYKYVEPLEIPLGERCESVLNRTTGEWEARLVTETFQYVPIIETLKLIMSNGDVRKYVAEEKSSTDGWMRNFRDGESFKNNPFFQKHPQALRIQLYYDDILINNPLGSKTHGHKLGMFYFSLQNLPFHLQSFLGGIHVLAICHTADVTKYGFHEVLRPFLDDLCKLECDEGVPVAFDGQDYVLHATIACVVADGLAAHQLGGMLSPSANRFCRLCMIHRRDWISQRAIEDEIRTRTMYEEHLDKMQRKLLTEKDTGLRENSALHRSRYWHCTNNYVFDPMHDIWQGVAHTCLLHVIKQFVSKRNRYDFSLETFNNRIQMFQYGAPEKKNKPSANFSRENFNAGSSLLKQRALQTWCLLRVFPFLVSDKVPEDDDYLHLILLLNRLCEIVFSPKVSATQAPYLKDLASELVSHFKDIFPDVDLINKFHHLQHYWLCMIQSGPLRSLSCQRYEAKHQIFKRHGTQSCNFKNVPLTMARLSQIHQCITWGTGDAPRMKIKCSKGQSVLVKNTNCKSELNAAGLSDNVLVFQAHSVELFGINYQRGLYVACKTGLETETGIPEFAEIIEIYVSQSENVHLLCDLKRTLGYEMSLNAYSICAAPGEKQVISTDALKDVKPFALWNDYRSTKSFIVLRHVLV